MTRMSVHLPIQKLRRLLGDRRGIAVSLLEATAVIAVGAILASAGTTMVADKIQDARVSAAHQDVSTIAGGMAMFDKNLNRFPVFKDGQKTGRADDVFFLLVSESGDAPDDATAGDSWKLPERLAVTNATTREWDTIENHLGFNSPGGNSNKAYPVEGEMAGGLGWAGPYMQGLGSPDPWGNKFLVNVQFMAPQGVAAAEAPAGSAPGATGAPAGKRWAVYVLSAGPNETVETPFQQQAQEAKALGDDILFRLQ